MVINPTITECQYVLNRASNLILKHDSAIIVTKYPILDENISLEHIDENLAIQLVLRRYRNHVFEFSGVIAEQQNQFLETTFIAVDFIGHKNLERVPNKIVERFSPSNCISITRDSRVKFSKQVECLHMQPLRVIRCIEYSPAKYPTELRTISIQEGKLRQRLQYNI